MTTRHDSEQQALEVRLRSYFDAVDPLSTDADLVADAELVNALVDHRERSRQLAPGRRSRTRFAAVAAAAAVLAISALVAMALLERDPQAVVQVTPQDGEAPAKPSPVTDPPGRAGAAPLPQTSKPEPVVPPGGGVVFDNVDLRPEAAIPSATQVFTGTVERLSVEPFGVEYENTLAVGRRVAWVRVTRILKGTVQQGSTVPVWYGTELKPGAKISGSADVATAPEESATVLIVGDVTNLGPAESEALDYELISASECAGIGIVVGESAMTRSGVIPMTEIEALANGDN